MNQYKKLALAGTIGMLLAGATSAQAHVSYNTSSSLANGNATNGAGTWTGGAATDYSGRLPVTWMAHIHGDNSSLEVSTADALAEGAPSGYVIETYNNKWNPASSWGNALDFGLISLSSAANLTIKVEADTSLGSVFVPGFTLWENWDETTTSSKHGSWNADPYNPGNRGASNLVYLGHASTTSSDGGVDYSVVGNSVEITFLNLAAGHYSLWIGGNGTGSTTIGQQYSATLTTAPVPVPAAVWLFGTAFAGMLGLGKRKQALQA